MFRYIIIIIYEVPTYFMYWSTGINSQLRMFQQYGGRTARNQTTFIHTLTEAKAPLQ